MHSTSSLSGESPCHVTVPEPFDPLWDDTMDFTPSAHMLNILTLAEKRGRMPVRLPAAVSTTNVPLPTPKEF